MQVVKEANQLTKAKELALMNIKEDEHSLHEESFKNDYVDNHR